MSNKTPPKPEEKTESAPKQRSVGRLIFAFGLVIIGAYLLVNGVVNITDNKRSLITPAGKRLQAEVADTPGLFTKGLSGRDGLDADKVMLFEFNETSQHHCMWMKDMKFNIDIVWLDEDKKVVDAVHDVSPETYPASFCPKDAARYVIELKSGEAANNKLEIGKQVRF